MRNSYQLAGQVRLPGFLGDLQNAGQNFGITNTDLGLGALNLMGDWIAERQAIKDNQAYENYWRRAYQMPENVINPFAFGDPNQMAKGGINIKPENRGKFTKWAKARGMTVSEAADKVMSAPKGKYSASVRKMANFAKNFAAYGGTLPFYKEGGEINMTAQSVDEDNATIEAEKGEFILGMGFGINPFDEETSNIGVGLYKIGGQKHYNGGTNLKAGPGDFIFSDDKSLSFSEQAVKDMFGKEIKKEKLRTPAKLAGQYAKLNEFIAEAQGNRTMPMDRKTALLNVENMMNKLADIAIGQEAQKGFPTGIPIFAQVSLDNRSAPMQGGELDQAGASLPMAKKGGQMKFAPGGPIFPWVTSIVSNFNEGEPWTGDKTKDKKGVFPKPKDNQFPGNYPEFENQIKQAGFTGNIEDNREIQRFLYSSLMNTPEGRNELGAMWNQYGITNYGQNLAGSALPANFNLQALGDPASEESVRLGNWGNFYDDGKIGVRTRMLANGLPGAPVTGYPNLTPIPGPGRPSTALSNPIPTIPVTPSDTGSPITNRNYNSPVNPNIAELYGFLTANRRYAPRYPTAQRFYEGENIDATLNAGYQPTSAQPVLNNIQRQMNVFNQNNSGAGPVSYARNAYAFTEGLNAQNNAIAQNQLVNTQRRDQLTNSLVQNQALKGQYRLQLQDKYLRELETVNNNIEQATKNRRAQTSNLLNSFVNRAYTQRYANSMMDYFEVDANGNLRPRPGINARQAIMEQTSSTGMNQNLRYTEQLFKLMQQYGIKGSTFVDDVIKGGK